MTDTTLAYREPRTDAEYKTAIDDIVAELERIDERIELDQREIDRLKLETRAILATLKK